MLIQRISLISSLLFLFVSLNAQVWTLPKNSVYTNIGWTGYTYSDKFDETGEIQPLSFDVTDNTIQLFAQYGITDKLTLQTSIPFKIISKTDYVAFGLPPEPTSLYYSLDTIKYFGNIELGGIYKIFDGKPMVSVSLMASLNSTDRNYISGLQTGFNSNAIKPGAGVMWSFNKAWLQYYLGAEIRDNNYAMALISNLEYGFKFGDGFYLAAQAYMRFPEPGENDCDCTTTLTAMYNSNQTYMGLGLKGGYSYKAFGINAGLNTAFFAKNAPAQIAPSISLQYKY
jgi:hypothetical protein